ncbi:RusA family crossover junction endodeoxyribonuclease [Gulosibacter molinativorax]|uniref:RusA family crossover junction endodeoxyribonuclease n=1 Tax=Gulosibacter molinativorax TaxID=256821 RepID=A0ABT7C9L2_9MICO|nr:RusA family crossover junction endodeoxyribonuclease [Gulosibacter molinativorax]MDJ1371775.1 RusA family crossover junction endodeoxyribonuclease [Gulosibacter molinativorax]QUY60855.1 Hypotetical protein [Gulosibacter molinativorax]
MITFRVDGVPIAQGSKSAYIAGNRAVMFDQKASRLNPWRKKVADAARATGVTHEAHAPLVVQIVFILPRGKTVKREHPTTKPDGDKTERAIWDALTQSGLIHDDAQIVEWSGRKRYQLANEEPGVVIRVYRIEEKEL